MSHETPPEHLGESHPLKAGERRRLLKRTGQALAITVGGVVTFAVLVTPSRARGASQSAQLRWQQRQSEIRQVIQAAAADTPKPAAPARRSGHPSSSR